MSLSQLTGEDSDEEAEKTFVVECSILGLVLLLPFPLSTRVDGIAARAYDEYKLMNPRAPPLKITCVRDKFGKILSRELSLQDHHLDRQFVIQVEEYNPTDLLQSPEGVTSEYRKWQLWTVHQIFDMIRASLRGKLEEDGASVALKVEALRNSKEGPFMPQYDDVEKDWAPIANISEQDVDQKWIVLLDELTCTPDEQVKCACLEALNLLRLRSSSLDIVKGASLRICQMIVDEQEHLNVLLCALNCFRVNAKGLMPLSSYHQKEIMMLKSSVVKEYMNLLSRFPRDEDQRLIMGSYKSMYIHCYGMDTGIERSRQPDRDKDSPNGAEFAGQEASHVFAASDTANAEETVARLRTLLESKEESVWKFAITKLHTLLNEIRNPLDHTSCFDASVESKLSSIFQTNQEVRSITGSILGCLKGSIDTRSKYSRARKSVLEGDGSRKGPRGRPGKGGKAKALIDSALLSPETDIPMVKKIIDCLYLLALPFSFDVGVSNNSESTRLNAIQVSIAKTCLENERWRLLLTLCFTQNLAIAGRCAYLFRMLVLVQGRENTEGNHWEKFQSIIEPTSFVVLLNNDATSAADYKAVEYSDHLNSTGFGTNKSSDIDSVELLEAHLGLLVLDYTCHLLNARHEVTTEAKRDQNVPPSGRENTDDNPVQTARGEKGVAAFEKILAKTGAAIDGNREGLPSKISEVEIDGESGVEYLSKLVPKGATSADKYILEDIFMDDNNKLFLKLWRIANYTEMPSLENRGRPRDSLRIFTCYQQRRLSLDIISQLVAMDSSFKDQLNRLAGVAKLIALMADKSIMRVNLDDYGGGPPVSPRLDDPDLGSREDGAYEGRSEFESKDNSFDLGKVDADDIISRQVDVEAIRYALKILVTLIVSQDQARQKTIVRLIQNTQVGAQENITLKQVAQIDRQSAFFYATILTLGNRFD